MSFRDDLQRHRERERQQREEVRQEQARRTSQREQRDAIERTWSLRVCNEIVFQLLQQFADAYSQNGAVRKFCAADDPADVQRCSLEWKNAAYGRFRVSFRVEYQAVRFDVCHASAPHTDDSISLYENWLDCEELADAKIADWVRLQLMNAASKIDEQCSG